MNTSTNIRAGKECFGFRARYLYVISSAVPLLILHKLVTVWQDDHHVLYTYLAVGRLNTKRRAGARGRGSRARELGVGVDVGGLRQKTTNTRHTRDERQPNNRFRFSVGQYCYATTDAKKVRSHRKHNTLRTHLDAIDRAGGEFRQGAVDALLDIVQHAALAPDSGGSTVLLVCLTKHENKGEVNPLHPIATPNEHNEVNQKRTSFLLTMYT